MTPEHKAMAEAADLLESASKNALRFASYCRLDGDKLGASMQDDNAIMFRTGEAKLRALLSKPSEAERLRKAIQKHKDWVTADQWDEQEEDRELWKVLQAKEGGND